MQYNVATGKKIATLKLTAASSVIEIARTAAKNNVLSEWGPYLCKFILACTEMDKEERSAGPLPEAQIRIIRTTLRDCNINVCSAVTSFLDDVYHSTLKIEGMRQDSVELKHLQTVLGGETSSDVATLKVDLGDDEGRTVTVWVSTIIFHDRHHF